MKLNYFGSNSILKIDNTGIIKQAIFLYLLSILCNIEWISNILRIKFGNFLEKE